MIVHFDSATPGTIIRGTGITGLQPGERVAGIDVRPATGQLYGVGIVTGATDTGRLYLIDPFTGTATQVGSAPFATDLLTAAAYGVDFTISPPSGIYATNQAFDLQLFVEAAGRTIVGGSITFDGLDVITALAGCLLPGTQVPGGGLTLRCPGLSGALLGVGTHTLSATLTFSGGGANGASATSSVTWTVVQTTEP